MAEKTITSKDGRRTVSRRQFLIDAGLVMGGTAIGSTALLAACSDASATETVTSTKTVTNTLPGVTTTVTVTTPVGSDTASIGPIAEKIVKLNVNNEEYNVMVRPNWTLQYVLNDKLGFFSAKEWCGEGACGACTVNMDGLPILSCMMLAIECEGKSIETAEGIAHAKHPLIDAYVSNNCMQCGYCTPGFVVTAKALLDKNPNPTKEQIWEALGGNLCRCSTYPQHVPAIQEAAQILSEGGD